MKFLYFILLDVGVAIFGFGIGSDYRALQLREANLSNRISPQPSPTQEAGQIPPLPSAPSPKPLTLKEIAIRDLKKQILAEQDTVNKLSDQLSTAEQQPDDSKLTDLSNQLTDQNQTLHDLAAEIQLQNQQTFQSTTQENNWAEGQNLNHDLELSGLQDQIKQASAKVQDLTTTVSQLRANNVDYADLPAMEIQLQEAKDQLTSLQTEYAGIRSQAGVAADQKEEFDRQVLENLRSTQQALQSRYQQELAKNETLQSQFRKLQQQVQDRGAEAEALNDKLDSEKHRLDDLQEQLRLLSS